MPSIVATPAGEPGWRLGGGSASPRRMLRSDSAPIAVNSPAGHSRRRSRSAAETNGAQVQPTPVATPTDIAPLEVGSVAPQSKSAIRRLTARSRGSARHDPALAASLRVTDQARDQLLKASGRRRDSRPFSARFPSTASNPYAYFYLGRAIPGEKKLRSGDHLFYPRGNPASAAILQWLGETLAFEGLANEQLRPDRGRDRMLPEGAGRRARQL